MDGALGDATGAAGFRAARLSRDFLRFAIFFSFLIDAHRDKFHHLILHAKLAFQFPHGLWLGSKLQQHVKTFGALLHAIGEFADRPTCPLCPRYRLVRRSAW